MSAKSHTIGSGAGYASGLWPVLLSLVVVLLPTACVLWFLNEAAQNERLAARQKLTEAVRGYLPMLRDRLQAYWQRQAEALDAATANLPAPAAFAACVGRGLADSVVCRDAEGQPAYPALSGLPAGKSPAAPAEGEAEGAAWTAARQLEHSGQDSAAAAAYGELARQTSDRRLSARALQAQARCLARAGRTAEAIRILDGALAGQEYSGVVDSNGRSMAVDAQLRSLELLGDRGQPEFAAVAQRLAARLNAYDAPRLPSAQRRFAMQELRRLTHGASAFPTLEAEELAAAYLESDPPAADGALRPAGPADVWRFPSQSGRIVALLRTPSVLRQTAELIAADVLPGAVRVAVVPPEAEAAESVVHLLPAGAKMPGWRLTLVLADDGLPDASARQRVAARTWIAVLVIAAMSIVAAVVAAALRRQMRLTRLKNDLLATVSHELKTPLSSMRLLVDTLLDAEELDVGRTRDYLRLLAKENARLSHLIDNFLSFSRMERGKQTFEMAEVSAAEIARQAVEAAGERFQSPPCSLEVSTAADVPCITADADALVTAILNLLDNAYKYSGDCKQIALRTYAADGELCFAVSDNGVGLSPQAARKVFRPFYQVDQHLSRVAGGCGLGLSIVKYIVAAHGGTIRVQSRQGEGSTFTIGLALSRPVRPDKEALG